MSLVNVTDPLSSIYIQAIFLNTNNGILLSMITSITPFLLVFFAHAALSAFTKTARSGQDYVEPNTAGTWCYYPGTNSKIDVACVGNKAEFAPVIDAHISQGVSISYYGADHQRLGGAEYPVKTTAGKVYLCLSGRAGDGTYKTECEISTADNQFGLLSRCALAVSQKTVTDGCYVSGVAPTPANATSSATGTRPAESAGSTSSGTASTLNSASATHKSYALGLGLTTLVFVFLFVN